MADIPTPSQNPAWTHFDAAGKAKMADVGQKPETLRIAKADGAIAMSPSTLEMIQKGTAGKGDVLGIARIAGIQAAKRTADLIPLCHPVFLNHVHVDFMLDAEQSRICCVAVAKCCGRTGVEMEALTAVSVALLTIYDMCKSADRGMVISAIRLLEKKGGKSGHWQAD